MIDMKKAFILFAAVFAALVSCQTVDPIEETKGTITVTPADVVFGMDEGEVLLTLTLNSSVKEWSLTQTGGEDWCMPSKTSGKTSTTIKVTAERNVGDKRTSTLQFDSPGCEPAIVNVVQNGIEKAAKPEGFTAGFRYNDDNSVSFIFLDKDADGKSYDYAYLIGEFNDWTPSDEYLMHRDDEAGCWWYTLKNLDPNKEYMFQYYLGNFNEERGRAFADPFSPIVYEPYDRHIAYSTYPDLRDYPTKTKGAVSAFRINMEEYQWEVDDYKIEDENDLLIYELLLRDFSATGDLNGAMEKLDYLEALGINAIELMPIHEFNGSDSWGYNPISYFGLEKSYGTRDMYKKFIDACHKRGIAVIVDVVYNHAHEDHPYAGLYFDWSTYLPTANNPWFNVVAPHPFSVFHDWNHENEWVRSYVKMSLEYLIDEYKVDGFRFDLTKGFTNKQSNESSASNYDASRVAILKDYAGHIKQVDPNAVVIFEHFADAENNELGKAGAKIWRNLNWAYRQTLSGSNANLNDLWTGTAVPFGTYVGYMESHDEERTCFGATADKTESVSWGICGTLNEWGGTPDIAFAADGALLVAKNVTFTSSDMFKIRGNNSWNVDAYNLGGTVKGQKLPLNKDFTLSSGGGSADMAAPAAGTYDVYFSPAAMKVWVMTPGSRPADPDVQQTDALTLAMKRAACNAAFFFTVPGPKMIWQFGELGYDISIEENGRTGKKPLHWEYFDVPARKELYDTYAGLMNFRAENPRFFDSDATFRWAPSATTKTIFAEADGKRFAVVGNFAKGSQTVSVTLPAGGTWTNWFDKSEKFNGASQSFKLNEGEFKLLVNF